MNISKAFQSGRQQRKKCNIFKVSQFTGINKFYRDRAELRLIKQNAKSTINCDKSLQMTVEVIENGGEVMEIYKELDDFFDSLINKCKETENEYESLNEQELDMIMEIVDEIHDKDDIQAVMSMVENIQREDDFNTVMQIIDENIKSDQWLEIDKIVKEIYNEKELELATDFLFPSTKLNRISYRQENVFHLTLFIFRYQ